MLLFRASFLFFVVGRGSVNSNQQLDVPQSIGGSKIGGVVPLTVVGWRGSRSGMTKGFPFDCHSILRNRCKYIDH